MKPQNTAEGDMKFKVSCVASFVTQTNSDTSVKFIVKNF